MVIVVRVEPSLLSRAIPGPWPVPLVPVEAFPSDPGSVSVSTSPLPRYAPHRVASATLLGELRRCGAGEWRLGPHSLHTAEVVGSNPTTPTPVERLPGVAWSPTHGSKWLMGTRWPRARFTAHGPTRRVGTDQPSGAGEVAVDRGATHAEGLGDRRDRILLGRIPLRHITRGTSDTIGHGDLAGHRSRAHPAAASPQGDDPGRWQPPTTLLRIGACFVCFERVEGAGATR
jgi:hypothetical protein